MKRALTSLIALCLLLISTPAQAGTDQANFALSWWPTTPSLGFMSKEVILPTINSWSYIKGLSPQQSGGLYTIEKSCLSASDPACSDATSIFANIYLPPCETKQSPMCVKSLEVGEDGREATFVRQVGSKTTPADTLRNLPFGGGISLWKNSNGRLYSTAVRINYQSFTNQDCVKLSKSCQFQLSALNATVFPVTLQEGNYTPSSEKDLQSNSENYGCAWSDTKICARLDQNAPLSRIALTIDIDKNLSGFLNGRMRDVSLSLTPQSDSISRLRVSGIPVDVPSIYATVPTSELSQNPGINNYWKTSRADLYQSDISGSSPVIIGPPPGFNMGIYDAFSEKVQPGEVINNLWRFTSSLTPVDSTSCFKDGTAVLGLVTTNASAYTAGPPSFNAAEGSIDYQVGGAHLLPDGSVFKGTYDLTLRSDVARCLYKFSQAPIRATISILGEQKDAATISQNEANGWLTVHAANFTFSKPTIRIKLQQENAAQPAAQPAAPPAAVSSKPAAKISITCVKGKTSKKITAVNPTCPAGYKKK